MDKVLPCIMISEKNVDLPALTSELKGVVEIILNDSVTETMDFKNGGRTSLRFA